MRDRVKKPLQAGFTLLELVVVMAILVVLAGVAVRSMEGLDQQARFDATLRSVEEIRSSVAVIAAEPDHSFSVAGFAADLGRLPKAVGADASTQLAELWSNPRNLAPFAIRPAPSDSEVLVASGWRGPYLRLEVGRATLLDGWGQPFDMLQADGVTPASDGDDVAFVRSRGADGVVDSEPIDSYDADLTTSLAEQGLQATLSGRVLLMDASTGQLQDPDPADGSVTIRLFGPNPATGLPGEQVVTVAAPFSAAVFSFNTTIGPKVIRAYQGDPTTRRSVPIRLMLRPGGEARDLILR